MNAIETGSLSKRYGRTWALDGCTLAIPTGRVVALVGPNGAGKTTLLHLAVGLTAPTRGAMTVLGGLLPGSEPALERIGFVAQDTPLYKNLSVADTLRLVANLSATWDEASARAHLDRLEIPPRPQGRPPLGGPAGAGLPGGRTEPAPRAARARRTGGPPRPARPPRFHGDPDGGGRRGGHLRAVLQPRRGGARASLRLPRRPQPRQGPVVGDVEGLLDSHRIFTGPTAGAAAAAASLAVVQAQPGDRQTSLLARTSHELIPPEGWAVGPTNLEELVLAYLRSGSASALPGPQPSPDADVRATA